MKAKRRRLGTGCLPDAYDPRDLDVDALGLASSALPSSATLAAFEPPVRNQGATNTCVAQALAAAIDICELRAGLPLDPVSELQIYWESRRRHGAQMIDGGTHVRTACQGLREVGAGPRELWPWSKRIVSMHRRPGWKVYMASHPRKGGSYYRIADHGEARLQAIRAAIVAGHPVVFGTTITDQFQQMDGPWVIDRPDFSLQSPIGGHAMCIVGYDASGFRILNSWGTRWRAAGHATLTNDYMSWYQTRDLWIVEGWRRLQDAREAMQS